MSLFIRSFKNLRWYEWAMFTAMVLIGGYCMLTDTTHPAWIPAVTDELSTAG